MTLHYDWLSSTPNTAVFVLGNLDLDDVNYTIKFQG